MNQDLERFEPAEVRGRMAYEHLHRYAICRERASGKRVLDVACGTGYGTSLLAQTAAEATGVDIDPAAIRQAKKKFRSDNLSFVAADCTEMPFDPGSFEVAVANEMIEHIEDHDRFLEEVKRVLQPGGTLLISTPNKPVYNRYKTPNPFHVSEMDIPEFRRLLKRHFKHVRLTGLRMALVSAGYDIEGSKHPSNLIAAKTYRGGGIDNGRPSVSNEELSLDEPEYVLATCSDHPIEEDVIPSTIFFSNEDDLWQEHEKVMAWASQLHDEDELLRTDLLSARSELEATSTALEEQKRVNGDIVAKAGVEHRQHLAVSSRLLSRLTAGDVQADPIAVVEALFALNEERITQRLKLETLEGVQHKAAQVERQLLASRAAQDRLAADIRRVEAEVQERTSEVAEVRVESERLCRELEASRAAQNQLAEQVQRAERGAAEANRQLHDLRGERERLERELTEARAPAPTPPARSDETARNNQTRRSARLAGAHREVAEQLAAAHQGARATIAARSRSRRSLTDRLLRRSATYKNIPFQREWIKRQVPDASGLSVAALVEDPRFRRVDPHPLFSTEHYLGHNPDIAEAGVSPVQHYAEHGWREGRNPHPYFANDWYLQQNPDVARAGVNPLAHYLEHGWKEGRRPNPVFDPEAYLARNQDVRGSGIEPLTHFVMYGRDEDREIPFRGLERDWRALVASSPAGSLMDHLLSEVPATAAPSHDDDLPEDYSWPPRALNDFWLPQALRDFVIESGREHLIPLFTYFYSVMDAYSEAPERFPSSLACQRLMKRAQTLSASRRVTEDSVPAASIIIPVYNNILDTMLCIVSLLETEPKQSFEIIVADDCSTDATARMVADIGGVVRHLRQTDNQGFVDNCNLAALGARGDHIILLNNDTLVLPGWLENLLEPFERLDRIGLVGSKLISWDGRLQEAGGIFWSDGSAWNFGRGRNAGDPEFNYLKDTDYCSGASIAIPAELWRDLRGFDPRYRPAYCEDSDLAFRIRAAGFRTIYSPHSELIHHEGRSHGRDVASGIKANQLYNQQQLTDAWRDVLQRDHFENGAQVLKARDRSGRKPHILVIDHYVPQFDKDAGSRTMFQFIEALTEAGWAITFWPENLYRDPHYTGALQQIGVEVIYGPKYAGNFADFLRSREGLYDAVLLSRPHVSTHFIDDVRRLTDARVLYYGHDVHFERMQAQLEIAGSTMQQDAVDAMRTMELGLCNQCDVVLYPSEEEARLISTLIRPAVRSAAIPAYRFSEDEISRAAEAASDTKAARQSAELLFVGGFSHGPNVDGIVWFCREVAPILRAQDFQFELRIVGSNPTSDVWDVEADDIQVLGYVSDERLGELYREASLVIAPLRFGAGVKGKVVEAMARGAPVVTTDVGAQGLSNADDYLFLGNTPEEFAAAIVAAVDADNARAKVTIALEYIRENYSRAAMIAVFADVLPGTSVISEAA